MRAFDLHMVTRDVISRQHEDGKHSFLVHAIKLLLLEMQNIAEDTHVSESLKMTRMSILFEGFYRSLQNADELKTKFSSIRIKRWGNHFGTPTVPFLISYKSQISETCAQFKLFPESTEQPSDIMRPWLVTGEAGFEVDNTNNVVVEPASLSRVAMPTQRETMGSFIKTHNPFGGFTTVPCDSFSQRFIEHAVQAAKDGGEVLEIGAAFGAATLDAIARGATVFCNDIDPENLAVVRNRFTEMSTDTKPSITGDDKKLVLIPGEFPTELAGLPKNSFDAILICRVLHFFPGKKIEESLKQMAKLLVPGGKIYIVCETPYLKNWQRFIPEFNDRVKCGVEWPGELTNPADYESSGRAASLPAFVHWITKEILERSLVRTGFVVADAAYINRQGQFPDDLLLHGKESVGVIGVRAKL